MQTVKTMKKKKTLYAHNENYCMILPNAKNLDEEDIVTGSQS